jgi:hypothetical protein
MAERYINFWRFIFDPADVESMDDLVTTLESFAEALVTMRKWRDAGIQVDHDQAMKNLSEGYIGFVTQDAEVAKEFGFTQEED